MLPPLFLEFLWLFGSFVVLYKFQECNTLFWHILCMCHNIFDHFLIIGHWVVSRVCCWHQFELCFWGWAPSWYHWVRRCECVSYQMARLRSRNYAFPLRTSSEQISYMKLDFSYVLHSLVFLGQNILGVVDKVKVQQQYF